MFCFCSSAVATATIPPIPEDYRSWGGAGLVFTSGDLILCGYEPNKKVPAIYGIGGKRESTDTTFYHTAFREAFEELLGVGPSAGIMGALIGAAVPKKTVKIGGGARGYIMIQYGFADLVRFLEIMRRASMRTPFYPRLPRSIEELLTARRCAASTEMTHLCLLPVVSPAPVVSRDLAGDIERIAATEKRAPQ
jgi:hypothetical protein